MLYDKCVRKDKVIVNLKKEEKKRCLLMCRLPPYCVKKLMFLSPPILLSPCLVRVSLDDVFTSNGLISDGCKPEIKRVTYD